MEERGVEGMRRLSFLRFLIVLLLLGLSGNEAYGWMWGKTWLVRINGQEYTKDDYIHWWENWKDKDTPPPESLEPFIDWFLLVQEGERMRLFETPDFRRKVRIFLEVRALMLLKNEEVDSKIKITEKEMREVYRRDYVPMLHVRAVNFPSEGEARAFLEELKAKDMEKLVEEKFPEKNRRAFDWGWRRPSLFPQEVREVLLKARKGEVVGPLHWMGKYWLIKVVDRKEGSDQDFEKVKNGIRRKLWKGEENRLTARLIERLKKKYNVWVDQELLKSLDVEHPKEENLDKPLVRMGETELKVRDFLKMVDKEYKFRKKYRFSTKDMDRIKRSVMANLISQTLTSWEALSRHYERKPPFKWVYRFYCQHRIIKELENQLFWPKVKVAEEDARRYYQEHLDEFRLPGLVKVAFIQTGDEKLAQRIEKALNRGEDFFEVARKFTFHGASVQKVPIDHLVPEMREAVSRLSPGEVSSSVKVGSYIYIVKLIERVTERQKPFEEVKKSIMEKLKKERFEEIKKSYLSELKRRSKIEVNEAAWKRLRKELRERDETNKKAG